MALLDFIPGGDWSFLILAVVIVLIVFIWPKIVKKRAEAREIRRSGPTARKIKAALEAEAEEEKHTEAAEEAVEKDLPKGKFGEAMLALQTKKKAAK